MDKGKLRKLMEFATKENVIIQISEQKIHPFEISLKDVDREALHEEVQSRQDWCEIEYIGGELDLGIFIATFADDYRFVFEVDDPATRIRLMLTCDQIDNIKSEAFCKVDNTAFEEMQQTLNTILRYYLWWKEEEHG